jgi:exopolysaccharide production protein ExoZ
MKAQLESGEGTPPRFRYTPAAHAHFSCDKLNSVNFIRFRNLQVLRALAATMVVIFHANGTGEAYLGKQFSLLGSSARYGVFGADLFFVISGFIIYFTNYSSRSSPGTFLARRLKRILPSYWLFTGLTLALFAIAPMINSEFPSVSHIARSLLFVSFLKDNMPVVFVGWTLEYEMFFYLSVFGALWLQGQWRLVTAIFSILVFFGIVLGPEGTLLRFLTMPVLAEFCLGMVAADAVLNRTQFDWISFAAVVCVCTAIAYSEPMSRVVIAGIPAALIVLASALTRQLGIQSNLIQMVRLGDASYAIYLTQVLIVPGSAKFCRIFWPNIPLDLFVMSTTVLTIIAGYVWYRVVERPIALLLRSDDALAKIGVSSSQTGSARA